MVRLVLRCIFEGAFQTQKASKLTAKNFFFLLSLLGPIEICYTSCCVEEKIQITVMYILQQTI